MELHKVLATCLGAVAAAAVAEAAAQTPQPAANSASAAATQVEEEIIVSARRRAERLSDVPVAASVITGDQVEARGGVATSGELLAGQAGVRFLNTTSATTAEISIRGSGTGRGTTAESAIGVYRNNMYIGGGQIGGRNFSRFDFFDVGRVEVLRGTQGALFGRNAVGGVVNIVSAEPQFNDSGYIDVRRGVTLDSTQIGAVANFDLTNAFAVRFGGEYVDQDDGFFYNPQNDTYFDKTKGGAVRAQALYQRGPLTLRALAEHQHFDIPAITYQVVIAPQPSFPFGYVQPKYEYPWSTQPFAEQSVNVTQFTAEYDLGWAELSVTQMNRTRLSRYAFDSDAINPTLLAELRATGIAPNTTDANVSQTSIDDTYINSQDARLVGHLMDGRLSWLLGLESYDLKSDGLTFTTRTPTPANRSPGARSPTIINVDSISVYGSLGADFTERVNLTIEGRQTNDERTFFARRFDAATGLPTGGAAFIADARSEPDNLSYNIVASFRPYETGLVYAKYGTSFRAGGFNQNLGIVGQPTPIPAAYGDETIATAELGFKGRVAYGLQVNFAVYMSEIGDQIVQRDNGCTLTLCGQIATSFLTNAGEGETQGIEVDLSRRFQLGPAAVRVALAASHQDGEITAGPLRGAQLPQIPEWLTSAEINVRAPVATNMTVFSNIAYSAQTGGVQEVSAPNFPLDDFQLVNVRAGVDFGRFQIAAIANNLFDEEFRVFRSTTTSRLNQPRNVSVQLRANW